VLVAVNAGEGAAAFPVAAPELGGATLDAWALPGDAGVAPGKRGAGAAPGEPWSDPGSVRLDAAGAATILVLARGARLLYARP
jgi:hypothetical protein